MGETMKMSFPIWEISNIIGKMLEEMIAWTPL